MTIENGHALKHNSTTLLGNPSLIPKALETMDQTMDVTAHSGNLWHYNYQFAYPAHSSFMISKQRLAGKDSKSHSERFPFHIWWIWDKCFGYRYSRCDLSGKREVNCSSVLHACQMESSRECVLCCRVEEGAAEAPHWIISSIYHHFQCFSCSLSTLK